MYLRCPECIETSWIEVIQDEGLRSDVTCDSCLRTHAIAPAETLAPTVSEHYRRTLELSNANGIDMPGAYAVLLGIMPLSRAQRLQRENETAAKPEVVREAVLSEMDTEFKRAVSAGNLTTRDVAQRGDREAMILGLMERHRLSRALATLVADNKLSLHEALTRQPLAEPPAKKPQTSRLQKALVLGVALAAVGAVAAASWQRHLPVSADQELGVLPVARPQQDDGPELRTVVKPRVVTEVDDARQVVAVTGPDARSVLDAYCEAATTGAPLEPLRIIASGNRADEARLGVFRDPMNLATLYTIRIRRDRKTHRWTAGSGSDPVAVSPLKPSVDG